MPFFEKIEVLIWILMEFVFIDNSPQTQLLQLQCIWYQFWWESILNFKLYDDWN